jgi:hypothetical protein
MQVTQTLSKTEYWVNFREECAAYIEKHFREKIIAIEPIAIIPKKEELVFTPPEKEQCTSVYNVDAEFILEERASIFCEDAKIPYEWATAILKLNLRQKPFSISSMRWDNIKTALDLLCKNEYEVLKTIISHDWGLNDIFGCYKQEPEKVYPSMGLLMLWNKGDKVIEVNGHAIKTQNKRGGVLSYTPPYSGYRVQQILIHDLP